MKIDELWCTISAMHALDDRKGNGFWGQDPLRSETAEESELAFQVQNSQPNDPSLLRRLVEFYASDLGKWIRILLYYRDHLFPTSEQVFPILKETFQHAITHTSEFYGRASVYNWLFGISYKIVKQHTLAGKFKRLFRSRKQESKTSSAKSEGEKLLKFGRLTEKIRSVLILRYLFGLEISDVAAILNHNSQEIHRLLIVGRRRLFAIHKPLHKQAEIQAYVDGLLKNKPEEQVSVLQHIDACVFCKKYTIEISKCENLLRKTLQNQWDESELSSRQRENLLDVLMTMMEGSKNHWYSKIPLKQATWIMGLSVMFIGLAVVFVRLTPAEREFPDVQQTATPALPPIVEVPQERQHFHNQARINQSPQYIDPAFSSNGEWAVFASIGIDSNTQSSMLPTIELYNREQNTIQVISEGEGTLGLPWTWWNFAPSISGDGQWIAYVSTSNKADIDGIPCTTPNEQACLDVFLFNRLDGKTVRVTQASDGGAADGDSLAPTISEDGKWLAFWSAANNLVYGNEENCQLGEHKVTCLYIYLYSIQDGNTQWIPARNIPSDVAFGVDRISLSADGRYVGFTATQSSYEGILSPVVSQDTSPFLFTGRQDNLQTNLPSLKHSSEAVVYDREKRLFELENQVLSGTLGNGASSSPVLSADGRYVAFVADSDNLVETDRNNYGDVFLRDRETGQIELISVSSNGQQGNANSGATFWGRGYYSINLSMDGRYVVFESSATNLGQNVDAECNRVFANFCNLLYIHDNQTGNTEWISALPNQDFSLFPEISADGRWLTFMQSFYNCSSEQVSCSNVMLFDTQNEWMTNLTQNDREAQLLPWNYLQNLALPWGAWQSTAMSFSPDGDKIALGGIDSQVRIWQISNGDPSMNDKEPISILQTKRKEYLTSLAFSHNGEWLAVGTASGIVYIWNLPDHRLIYSIKDQVDPIKLIQFTKDNNSLYIATLNKIWFWNIGDHELINSSTISLGNGAVYALAMNIDDNILATAKLDGTVWLQNLPTGEVISRIQGDGVVTNSLTFSNDGSLLAFHSLSGKLFVWQIDTSDHAAPSIKFVNTFQSYGYIRGISFSPDNKYIAATGKIGEVALLNILDGNVYTLSTSVPSGMVYSIAFTTEGNRMAAAFENQVLIWRIPHNYTSFYFSHAASEHNDGPEPYPAAGANDLPILESMDPSVEAGQMTVEQMADTLKFPIILPTHLPDYISFKEAGRTQDGSIWLKYELKNQPGSEASLYIFERIARDNQSLKMTIGESALITPLPIIIDGTQVTAEYVSGDWLKATGFSSNPGGSGNGEMTNIWLWNDHSNSKRLRWQQSGILIALYYRVENLYSPVLLDSENLRKVTAINNILSQADLIQIAGGMKWYMVFNREITPIPNGQSPTGLSIIASMNYLAHNDNVTQQSLISNMAMDLE